MVQLMGSASANSPVPLMLVEPLVVPITTPASCREAVVGTTLILYSTKSTSQVKLIAATLKVSTFEMRALSGPVTVTTGTAVSRMISFVTTSDSLPTVSRTFRLTVFLPSPVDRLMD